MTRKEARYMRISQAITLASRARTMNQRCEFEESLKSLDQLGNVLRDLLTEEFTNEEAIKLADKLGL